MVQFSLLFYILCTIMNWFQICSRPDSDPSSPTYVSGNSSSTLSTGRPIVGQYLKSDTAQNNHDSTEFQTYQQNVSIILYITTWHILTHTLTLKGHAFCMQHVFMRLFDFLHYIVFISQNNINWLVLCNELWVHLGRKEINFYVVLRWIILHLNVVIQLYACWSCEQT